MERNYDPSMTVPDDSYSIKELLEKHIRGSRIDDTLYRPEGGYADGADYDSEDLEKLQHLDLFDREEKLTELKELQKQQEQSLKQQKQQKQEKEKLFFQKLQEEARARPKPTADGEEGESEARQELATNKRSERPSDGAFGEGEGARIERSERPKKRTP